jgi:hypothetical protein
MAPNSNRTMQSPSHTARTERPAGRGNCEAGTDHVPRHRDLGVFSRTASRSSLRVHTRIGPGASSGIFSTRPTSTSAPGGPMASSVRPTRPPPTTVAAIAADTLASLRDAEREGDDRRRRSGVTETAAVLPFGGSGSDGVCLVC